MLHITTMEPGEQNRTRDAHVMGLELALIRRGLWLLIVSGVWIVGPVDLDESISCSWTSRSDAVSDFHRIPFRMVKSRRSSRVKSSSIRCRRFRNS